MSLSENSLPGVTDLQQMTIADIIKMKEAGEKITMLTAYEAGFGSLLDQVGIDLVLVGDSLGMVALGYDSTVPVTMDEMIHHAKAVKKGVSRALVVGDMPFLSYQADRRDAIYNGGRFLKEAGCDAVKMEGGGANCATVAAMVQAGIPVMGHIGLTPQTAGQLGGYKVQGKDVESAQSLVEEARALVRAGVFALVLECIPDRLAEVITKTVAIPTIGIGAGAFCDGQVLVTHDLLGLFGKPVPSFVKTYVNLAGQIKEALTLFKNEVKGGEYPDTFHSFKMRDDVLSALEKVR